jgi:GNAT superfamily N-acetyltransferase
MTEFAIDRPAPADRSAWRVLWSGYCAFYQVPDPDGKADTVWSWLMDPAHPVKGFLARLPDGAPAGLVHFRPYPRPLMGTTGCFLDDLFVAPDRRGGGIAAGLIGAVADEARRNGWTVVRWITAEDNVRARALYDRVAQKTPWVTYDLRP